jgi:DNA-binding transcriptional MocR family regulator
MDIDATWLAAHLRARSTRGIAQEMGALIRAGAIPAGAHLPPVRGLAEQLGVSPATISAAWSELRRFNAIIGRGRTGMRVSGDPIAPRPARYGRGGYFGPGAIDLALASPDPALLPNLSAALRAAETASGLHTYVRVPILDALRDAVAPRWAYPAAAWLATNGGYDAVHIVLQALLMPGALVAVEEPTAIRLLDLLEAAGATPLPVACDTEGPLPGELAAALARRPAAFLFQPRTHAVTGHVVSPARMAALETVLRGHDTLVIEDDGIGDLSAAPPASLGGAMPGRVVHIRSFSKSLGPDFRLAVLSAAPDVVERIQAFRGFGVGWTSRILQAAAAALLTDPATDAVIALARATYAARRRALLAELAARGINLPDQDGLAIWLPVRSEQFALVTLAARNIAVIAGSACTIRPSAHVRVATSLLTERLGEVADALALVHADAEKEGKVFFL